jgi:hypothetical protein
VSITAGTGIQAFAWDRTDTQDKKGIQGADTSPIYQDLGIHHTLYNINLTDLLYVSPGEGNPYVYEGVTYYFNFPYLSPSMVTELNRQAISVSVVLLMPWEESMQDMIYAGARESGHTYYALNSYDAAAKKKWEALFHFLAENYSTDSCHIDNWILGNEVNMPNLYNYTGTTQLETNVEVYADSFVLLYKALRDYSASSRAYISLDHSWTHNDEGRGIAGKDFLDRFAAVIEQKLSGCEWNLAYHAYAPIMTDSRIWRKTIYSSKTLNTMFISADNLEVLTDYVKNTYGASHRIILSEQGFTSTNYGEEVQAAAIAYTYYKAEFNDMVDAVIFRSLYDEEQETASGFCFGLLDGTRARKAYSVFKNMNTSDEQGSVAACLGTIGISSWTQLIPEYDSARFLKNTSGMMTGTVTLGKYAAVFDPEYYLQNNPDVAKSAGYDFTAATLHFQTSGMTEGRRGSYEFDPAYYRTSNPDLNTAFGDEWWRYYEHYITHGISEGRSGHGTE